MNTLPVPESAVSGSMRRAVLIFLSWTVFGIYEAIQGRYQSSMLTQTRAWSSLFRSELSYAWICMLLTPFALAMAKSFRLPSRRWLPYVGLHALAAFLFGGVAKLLWDLAYPSKLAFFLHGITLHSIATSIAAGIDVGFLLYWLVLIAYWAFSYYRDLQSQIVAAAELRRQFASAQADALRMQLHPHFLFNTLNTITGLVHDNPDGAERMIGRLGDFLRHTLANRDTHTVPLTEELEFVRLYLDIQTVRFEDRLTVFYDIHPAAQHALVPSLILQPLVENAVRYAISKRANAARLSVSAHVAGNMLQLKVEDNGPGEPLVANTGAGTGLGLKNIRKRLETLYPNSHQVQYSLNAEAGVTVTLSLPLRPLETISADVQHEPEREACAS